MRLLGVFTLALVLADLAAGASISGTAYDSGLDVLPGVIVKVNSTPEQSLVLADGTYTLELPRGTYLLEAAYYENWAEAMSDAQELKVIDDGEYTVDLILLPDLDADDDLSDDFEIDEIGGAPSTGGTTEGSRAKSGLIGIVTRKPAADWGFITVVAGLVVVIMALAYLILKKKPKKPVVGKPSAGKPETGKPGSILPEDLDKVVSIIREGGGRVNQKDLRAKLPWSEAKVSLMVSDLEERGVVKRFKKGRGNIIRLEERG